MPTTLVSWVPAQGTELLFETGSDGETPVEHGRVALSAEEGSAPWLRLSRDGAALRAAWRPVSSGSVRRGAASNPRRQQLAAAIELAAH